MGSGKSTIGRDLARRLGLEFIDIDHMIESSENLTVKELFAQKGEPYFRRIETGQIRRALDSKKRSVISLGGGALMQLRNRDLVRKQALLIYIYSRPEEIYKRIKHSTKRPLFSAGDETPDPDQAMKRIMNLMEEREEGYNGADIRFDRDNMDAADAAGRIAELVHERYPWIEADQNPRDL